MALLLQGIVVEHSSVRGLAADCPFFPRLGSRHALSARFFPLSPPSRPDIFHSCVLVRAALGVPSNSICTRMGFHLTLHGNYSSVEGLPALRFCTGVIVAVPFQKDYNSPNAQASAQRDNQHLEGAYCGSKKFNILVNRKSNNVFLSIFVQRRVKKRLIQQPQNV